MGWHRPLACVVRRLAGRNGENTSTKEVGFFRADVFPFRSAGRRPEQAGGLFHPFLDSILEDADRNVRAPIAGSWEKSRNLTSCVGPALLARSGFCRGEPVANRRYGRMQSCATLTTELPGAQLRHAGFVNRADRTRKKGESLFISAPQWLNKNSLLLNIAQTMSSTTGRNSSGGASSRTLRKRLCSWIVGKRFNALR